MAEDNALVLDTTALLGDIRKLISEAHERTAIAVNREMTVLYWSIGKRISLDILGETRANYGEQILQTLSAKLTAEYGRGYSRRSLQNMIEFAVTFPDLNIWQSLIAKLSWTHFLQLIPIKDPLKRDFYAEMCRLERWSVRTLRGRIDSMLYERTVLSGKPVETIKADIEALRDNDRMTPDLIFRDPYLLDFLGLHDGYSEADLESAIIREMERFLLELGVGFAFLARQKRMTIDDEDFYLDLLLYHRKLRRLVAVELKLEKFTAAYKGQMELYLRWLDRYEREPGEEPPVGLILCSKKSPQQIELLQLDQGDIRVAEYFTRHLSVPTLEKELSRAVRNAREQLAQRRPQAELPDGSDETTGDGGPSRVV
jgi:predicted nuclease of restriction endonuclease-like (RecB) superfamily